MLLRLNVFVIILAALTLAACGSQSGSPSTVTVTQPQRSAFAEPAATSTTVPTPVTIPEVSGQNAEIVRKNLEKLGLTDVNVVVGEPQLQRGRTGVELDLREYRTAPRDGR